MKQYKLLGVTCIVLGVLVLVTGKGAWGTSLPIGIEKYIVGMPAIIFGIWVLFSTIKK